MSKKPLYVNPLTYFCKTDKKFLELGKKCIFKTYNRCSEPLGIKLSRDILELYPHIPHYENMQFECLCNTNLKGLVQDCGRIMICYV